MKCPNCGNMIGVPIGHRTNVDGVQVVMITCPHCNVIVGVVNAR